MPSTLCQFHLYQAHNQRRWEKYGLPITSKTACVSYSWLSETILPYLSRQQVAYKFRVISETALTRYVMAITQRQPLRSKHCSSGASSTFLTQFRLTLCRLRFDRPTCFPDTVFTMSLAWLAISFATKSLEITAVALHRFE